MKDLLDTQLQYNNIFVLFQVLQSVHKACVIHKTSKTCDALFLILQQKFTLKLEIGRSGKSCHSGGNLVRKRLTLKTLPMLPRIKNEPRFLLKNSLAVIENFRCGIKQKYLIQKLLFDSYLCQASVSHISKGLFYYLEKLVILAIFLSAALLR